MHFASYYRWQVYKYLFGVPERIPVLLDIGSDDGGFLERLPVQMSVAVDIDLRSLKKSQAGERVCADGTRLPFQNAQFDHVILSDVIEHVDDDAALLQQVKRQVKDQGTLWLSTTADGFELFPSAVTGRFERVWGHVRKGYSPGQLLAIIGAGFDSQLVVWSEPALRHGYLLLWLCSKFAPGLARALAYCCFMLDRRLQRWQRRHGHLYVRAVRTAGP